MLQYLKFFFFATGVNEEGFSQPLVNLSNTVATPYRKDVAIIGAGLLFPKQCSTMAQFWNMLVAGEDCTSEIPLTRFDISCHYNPDPDVQNSIWVKHGGFVEYGCIERFDHATFNISSAEVVCMDPQQRVVLYCTSKALIDANLDRQELMNTMTGVFIGCCNFDWYFVSQHRASPFSGTGASGSLVSNRVSYVFGLKGPSFSIDTACSSSLIAVDNAVEKLNLGLCTLAVAGGVNLMLTSHLFASFTKARMLAPDGRCKTFDRRANGYARGEGAGVVILELAEAIQTSGRKVWGIIKGSAVNHDGRSASLIAPNGPAQQDVIRSALRKAQLSPKHIMYVEAHGTGTSLGDPIEIGGLKAVFDRRDVPLLIGALKPNIGHAEGAAGIAGLLKLCLCLTYGFCPPTIHFTQLNPLIDLSNFKAVCPPTMLTEISTLSGSRRYGGVSAFGFGGANCHVILSNPTVYNQKENNNLPHQAEKKFECILPNDVDKTNEKFVNKISNLPGLSLQSSTFHEDADTDVTITGKNSVMHYFQIAQPCHPLVGRRISQDAFDVEGGRTCSTAHFLWNVRQDTYTTLFEDHKIYTNVVAPAALLLESLAACASTVSSRLTDFSGFTKRDTQVLLNNVTFESPAMIFPPPDDRTDVGQQLFCVSFLRDEKDSMNSVSGTISSLSSSSPPTYPLTCSDVDRLDLIVNCRVASVQLGHTFSDSLLSKLGFTENSPNDVLQEVKKLCSHDVHVSLLYSSMASVGLHYGERYQRISELHVGDDIAVIRLSLGSKKSPNSLLSSSEAGLRLHPAILDGAFQAAAAILTYKHDKNEKSERIQDAKNEEKAVCKAWRFQKAMVPVSIESALMSSHRMVSQDFWALIKLRECDEKLRFAFIDVVIFQENNACVAELKWVKLQRVEFKQSVKIPSQLLWNLMWKTINVSSVCQKKTDGEVLLQNEEESEKKVMIITDTVTTLDFTLLSELTHNTCVFEKVTSDDLCNRLQQKEFDTPMIVIYLDAALDIVYPDKENFGVKKLTDSLESNDNVNVSAKGLKVLDTICKITKSLLKQLKHSRQSSSILSSSFWFVTSSCQLPNVTSTSNIPYHGGIWGFLQAAKLEIEMSVGRSVRLSYIDVPDIVAKNCLQLIYVLVSTVLLTGSWGHDFETYRELVLTLEKKEKTKALISAAGQTCLNTENNLKTKTDLETRSQSEIPIPLDLQNGLGSQTHLINHNDCTLAIDLQKGLKPVMEKESELTSPILLTSEHKHLFPMFETYFLRLMKPVINKPTDTISIFGSVELLMRERGALSNLSLVPQPDDDCLTPLPDGYCRIRMRAVGLNFRDVLNVMGLYPGDPGPPGGDFSGTVLALGKNVKHLKVGDSVFGIAPGCLKTYLVTDAELVRKMPSNATFAQAAALPVVTVTVNYSLCELARVQPNEKVLIHAATGGVGLVAIDYCKRHNATAICTVGSEAKSKYLSETLGIQHIASSRDVVLFAQQMKQYVKEYGLLDVVLNSLSNDYITESLNVLKKGGIFIELGKRDILTHEKMKQIRPDVVYHTVAIDLMLEKNPRWFGDCLESIATQVEKNLISLLPCTLFNLRNRENGAISAFRYLQRAQHIGKVVIVNPAITDGLQLQNGVHVENKLQIVNELQGENAMRENSEKETAMNIPIMPTVNNQCYVIFGGMGALGSVMKEWLIHEGVNTIVLVSRHVHVSQDSKHHDFRETSITSQYSLWLPPYTKCDKISCDTSVLNVYCVPCDGSSLQQVIHLFQDTLMRKLNLCHITGIIHAAGVLCDRNLLDMHYEELQTCYSAKVDVLWNISYACELLNIQLKSFIIFSSISGVLGNIGQCNYAAANSCIDAFIRYRRSRGLPGQSIQWGAWTDQGMAVKIKHLLGSAGMQGISNNLAKRVVGDICVLYTNITEIMCEAFLWSTFLERYVEIPSFLSDLHTQVSNITQQDTVNEILKTLTLDQVDGFIEKIVEETVLEILGVSQLPSMSAPLQDLGIDSLGAVELRNTLARKLGIRIPTTALFDYPTLNDLNNYLGSQVRIALQREPETCKKDFNDCEEKVHSKLPTFSTRYENYAIIGASCRLPSCCYTLSEFWEMLANGSDCMRSVPLTRWNNIYASAYLKETESLNIQLQAGFVDDIDMFPACYFSLSAAEVKSMDPQQRLMLDVSAQAFSQAGYHKACLIGKKISVIIGCSSSDWHFISTMSSSIQTSTFSGTGGAMSLISNRVSYAFGLRGSSLTIDTACSSSLVALHSALNFLRLGQVTGALVGGVNLMLAPETFVVLSKARMLSVTSRCRTFDASADGYARGEGSGALFIVPFSPEINRNVLAIVKSCTVNHDGRSASLTAPNGPAQKEVIMNALQEAQIQPNDIGYIECHGTGTLLGDPIEVGALKSIFGNKRHTPLILGALKTNIGHLEAASGIASILKVILSLQHAAVPPNLHFEKWNPHIDRKDFSILLPNKGLHTLQSATNQTQILAGVSSFGFGGTNAHAIFEVSKNFHTKVLNKEKEKIVFICTGQGSQHIGMGQELYQKQPVFRRVIQQCHRLISRHQILPYSLLDIFLNTSNQTKDKTSDNKTSDSDTLCLNDTLYSQPLLFVVQYAFTELLKEWDIHPDIIIGHSLGEYLAALLSGVWTLDVALQMVCVRAKALAEVPSNNGVMVVTRLSEEEVCKGLERLKENNKEISDIGIAAVNGIKSITLSGNRSCIEEFIRQEKIESVKYLPVSHAFHSPMISDAVPKIYKAASKISMRLPSKHPCWVSTVSGCVVSSDVISPSYWAQHVVKTVRFHDALQCALKKLKGSVFIEISPKPILKHLIQQAFLNEKMGDDFLSLTLLEDNVSEVKSFFETVEQIYRRVKPPLKWVRQSFPWVTLQHPILGTYSSHQKRFIQKPFLKTKKTRDIVVSLETFVEYFHMTNTLISHSETHFLNDSCLSTASSFTDKTMVFPMVLLLDALAVAQFALLDGHCSSSVVCFDLIKFIEPLSWKHTESLELTTMVECEKFDSNTIIQFISSQENIDEEKVHIKSRVDQIISQYTFIESCKKEINFSSFIQKPEEKSTLLYSHHDFYKAYENMYNDFESFKKSFLTDTTTKTVYANYSTWYLRPNPLFTGVQEVRQKNISSNNCCSTELFVTIQPTRRILHKSDPDLSYRIHPVVLQSVFQVTLVFLNNLQCDFPFIPTFIQRAQVGCVAYISYIYAHIQITVQSTNSDDKSSTVLVSFSLLNQDKIIFARFTKILFSSHTPKCQQTIPRNLTWSIQWVNSKVSHQKQEKYLQNISRSSNKGDNILTTLSLPAMSQTIVTPRPTQDDSDICLRPLLILGDLDTYPTFENHLKQYFSLSHFGKPCYKVISSLVATHSYASRKKLLNGTSWNAIWNLTPLVPSMDITQLLQEINILIENIQTREDDCILITVTCGSPIPLCSFEGKKSSMSKYSVDNNFCLRFQLLMGYLKSFLSASNKETQSSPNILCVDVDRRTLNQGESLKYQIDLAVAYNQLQRSQATHRAYDNFLVVRKKEDIETGTQQYEVYVPRFVHGNIDYSDPIRIQVYPFKTPYFYIQPDMFQENSTTIVCNQDNEQKKPQCQIRVHAFSVSMPVTPYQRTCQVCAQLKVSQRLFNTKFIGVAGCCINNEGDSFRIGDSVYGLADKDVGTFCTLCEDALHRIPDAITNFEQAAWIALPLAVAEYVFYDLWEFGTASTYIMTKNSGTAVAKNNTDSPFSMVIWIHDVLSCYGRCAYAYCRVVSVARVLVSVKSSEEKLAAVSSMGIPTENIFVCNDEFLREKTSNYELLSIVTHLFSATEFQKMDDLLDPLVSELQLKSFIYLGHVKDIRRNRKNFVAVNIDEVMNSTLYNGLMNRSLLRDGVLKFLKDTAVSSMNIDYSPLVQSLLNEDRISEPWMPSNEQNTDCEVCQACARHPFVMQLPSSLSATVTKPIQSKVFQPIHSKKLFIIFYHDETSASMLCEWLTGESACHIAMVPFRMEKDLSPKMNHLLDPSNSIVKEDFALRLKQINSTIVSMLQCNVLCEDEFYLSLKNFLSQHSELNLTGVFVFSPCLTDLKNQHMETFSELVNLPERIKSILTVSNVIQKIEQEAQINLEHFVFFFIHHVRFKGARFMLT
jgi:acyl transferase domain-containing protein/NADPH:quinone reductase-like Zn-dependent oxidoreductase/acyl carrier protein